MSVFVSQCTVTVFYQSIRSYILVPKAGLCNFGPADFSSNPNQTHLYTFCSFLMILKTLISLFSCVWLGLELHFAGQWASSYAQKRVVFKGVDHSKLKIHPHVVSNLLDFSVQHKRRNFKESHATAISYSKNKNPQKLCIMLETYILVRVCHITFLTGMKTRLWKIGVQYI